MVYITHFEHAPWDGLTFADLLMPWFLFMAGVSIRFGIFSKAKIHEESFLLNYYLVCTLFALFVTLQFQNLKIK